MNESFLIAILLVILMAIIWLLWEIHRKLHQIANQNLQSNQAMHDALVAIYKKLP